MITASTRLAVAEITASLINDFDLPMLLQKIAVHAFEGFVSLSSAVVLVQDQDAYVVAEFVRAGRGLDPILHVSGPGLTSALDGAVAMITDMDSDRDDARWNRYRARAAADGVRSVRAFPIVSLGAPLGSLVVHTDDPWGTERPNEFGQILADLIALALTSGLVQGRRSTAADSVGTVLRGATTIALATGILAEHFGDGVVDARLRLARLARSHGNTATARAERIVAAQNRVPSALAETGVLDPRPDLEPPRHFDS